MREYSVYVIGGGFALGVWLASVWPVLPFDSWFFVCIGVALGVLAVRQPTRVVIALALGSVALGSGLWRVGEYESALATSTAWPLGEEVTFTGVVVKEPDERETSLHLYVQTTHEADTETLLVTTDRHTPAGYGDQVQVTGIVKTPELFTTDLGRTFNYPGYLKARGVTHTVSFAEVVVIDSGHGHPLIATLLALKATFLRSIEANLPEPQAGLSEGLLLGVKRALGEDLEHIFRKTGIIHIVVLSGYNIMLVVGFVLYVLALVLPWRARLVVGLLAVVAFALVVGLSATVVRASIMASLALIARAFGRTYAVLRALLVAGLLMLIINPYLLVFDVGFQLSFLATLGLILVSPHLEMAFTRMPTFLKIRELLVATLVTQLSVLPILLYQIGEFSLVSVAVNLLVLPMVPIAMLATFVLVLISFVSAPLSAPMAWLAYGSLTYIIAVPTFFASLPLAAFAVPVFPFWVVVVAYALLGYGLCRLYWPKDQWASWTIEEEPVPEVSTTDTPVFFR